MKERQEIPSVASGERSEVIALNIEGDELMGHNELL